MSKIYLFLITVSITTIFINETNVIAKTMHTFTKDNHFNNDHEKACEALEPRFNYNKTGFTVSFSDKSKGLYQKIVWDFGDGNNSKEVHPVHTYAASGTYKFTQTITSGEGCSKSFFGEIYIK